MSEYESIYGETVDNLLELDSVLVEFGGFYNTVHGDIIDNIVEEYFAEDINEDHEIPYKSLHDIYGKSYTKFLQSYLKDTYNLDIELSYLKINSPKYYNYKNDVMVVGIRPHHVELLEKYFLHDKRFIGFVRLRCTSTNGYISYYNYEQVLANENDVLKVFILDYIAEEAGKSYNWLEHQDINEYFEVLEDVS